jgi:hypothetical protein
MSEILIEPVKAMMEKACEAASHLLRSADPNGTDYNITITETNFEGGTAIYMKFNDKVIFQRIWQSTDDDDYTDISTVLYGSLLTEMIATFAVVVAKTLETAKG